MWFKHQDHKKIQYDMMAYNNNGSNPFPLILLCHSCICCVSPEHFNARVEHFSSVYAGQAFS